MPVHTEGRQSVQYIFYMRDVPWNCGAVAGHSALHEALGRYVSIRLLFSLAFLFLFCCVECAGLSEVAEDE